MANDDLIRSGTASVANGSVVVTGQTVAWTNVREGDFFGAHVGLAVPIATIAGSTITLAYPWPGATQVAAAYAIQPKGDVTRMQDRVRSLLESLTTGALAAMATLGSSADKLVYFPFAGIAALADFPTYARGLVGAVNDVVARNLLGLGNVNNTADLNKPVSTAQAAAIALVRDQITSNSIAKDTWVALTTQPGAFAGQGAEVLDTDTGAHTDPVAGGTVANAGRYSWSTSPAGWKRIGSTGLTAKADKTYVEANIRTGKNVNLIANGNLRGVGYGCKRYAPDYVAGQDDVGTPAVGKYGGFFLPIVNSYLNSIGCDAALDMPPVGQGNLLSQEVHLTGGYLLGILLIYSSTDDWGMGTGAMISLIARHTDGTSQAYSLNAGAYMANWSFETVAPNVRRYVVKVPVTAGKTISRLDFGGNDTSTPSRTANFSLTGFWVSWSDRQIDIADTMWPSWDNSAVPPVLTGKLSNHDTRLVVNEADIANLQTATRKATNSLAQLREALLDNTMSIDLVLVGDSNTWGFGVSGAANVSPPAAGLLTDVRNNLTSPSWANLLGQWLGTVMVSGKNHANPSAGVRSYYEDVLLDASRHHKMLCKSVATGLIVPPRLIVNPVSGPILNRYIDIDVGQMLEFTFTGDQFTVLFAVLNTSPAATFDVLIDGAVVDADVSSYASSAAFGQSRVVTCTFGPHTVRIVPKVRYLRIEGIGIRRKLIVRNQGLIGTNSNEWLPTGSIGLSSAVPSSCNFAIIMLGTNDRNQAFDPKYPNRTADNLHSIYTWLQANRANLKPILASNIKPKGDKEQGGGGLTYHYNSSETSRAIAELSERLGLGFIDIYGKSARDDLTGVSYLVADQLHLSDAGHVSVFDLLTAILRQ